MSRLRDSLGLERNILVMLAVIVAVGMGEELWSRFIPKYLELIGAGTFGIAAYGTLKDILDAVYQYPGGWLADRLGRRKALMLFTLLAMIGYLVYLLVSNWIWVLAGTVFVMAWTSLSSPAVFAIIGDTTYGGDHAARMMLHCRSMAFTAANGKPVQATAPLDAEFLAVCRHYCIETEHL